MKLSRIFIFLVVTAQFAFSESATWTSSAGNTIEASIVGFYGPTVFLEKDKKRGSVNIVYAHLDKESRIKRHSLINRMKGNGIPCLVITDREGRILAHSYRGDEYIGPSKPKELLSQFLSTSKMIREGDFLSGPKK